MISISRSSVGRSLPVLCLVAGCGSLLLSGCGGGGSNSNNGGGGGNNPPSNYTITVNSTNPASGATINYGNNMTSLLTPGTTPFMLTESSGTTMVFGAPATAGGNSFGSWSGCTSVSGNNCSVTVSGNATITANYVMAVAPTVTVTPGAATITKGQELSVGVTVAAPSGSATPTGSVVLTIGTTYTSTPVTLSGGSATIMVPAGSLVTGTDSLKATYTPDTAGAVNYTSASGTATVTVNPPPAPTIAVSLSASTIAINQPLTTTVTVSAAALVGATPTGGVAVTGGGLSSPISGTLSNGTVALTIPANSLTAGSQTLTFVYTPDSSSSANYSSGTKTASVTVNALPSPTMSLALASSTITTTQSLVATITVSGTPTPTGSIVLSSGSYTSASTTLNAGVAVITIPAGSLAAGSDTLTATYTPDSASSSTYGKGTQTAIVTVSYAVTVASSNPGGGVSITVSPKDVNGNGSGSTPISLAYGPNTLVTLTAPTTTATGNTFNSWTGCNSVSGTTCTLNVAAPATVTANYAGVSVSPSGNVTIGQSQQFAASVTGLTPSTVTWSVAIASGTGSAGTISSTGLYQTPYPAPASVTVTATSTANPSIKGTVTVTLAAPATATGPALSIDAGDVTAAINPLIYGMNGYLLDATTAQNANITVARWGGDDTSRYNYQTNVVNSANDYYFENFSGSNSMLPNGTNGNGTTFNDFMTSANALGISTIGTAPVIGWVSNGTVKACSFPKSYDANQKLYNGDNCGNGVESNGTSLVGNDTIAAVTSIKEQPPTAPGAGNANTTWADATWTGGWVKCLLTNEPSCSAGGKDATIWDLDNEPEYWSAVHRDVHPNPMTYDEITTGGIGTALAIKTEDPTAQVSGPVISGWYQYFYSQQDVNSGYSASPCYQPWGNPADRMAHNGVPLIEYYIQQMSAASDTYNVRLLDYVDIHAYYAATYNGSSVAFTTAGDTGEQQARMNSTRALWDPTYTDPNNTQLYQPVYPPVYPTGTTQTSAVCKTPASPELIPMMQKWATNDWTSTKFTDHLKTSIDEYNFGGTESINGAVTQADVLGIFGKYGLDMGVFWPTSGYAGQIPGNMAFEIYRNYDGSKSTFGDQELSSTTGDQSKLAVYAASRTSDGAVTIVVINKTYGPLSDSLSINNLSSTATSAQVYQYSNANLNAITAQPDVTITPPPSGVVSTLGSLTFPAQSITMIVIPSH